MGKKRGAPSPLTGKHEARDDTKGVGVRGKLVLQCVFEKEDDGMGGGCQLDLSGLGQGKAVGFFEYGNEPSGSIKTRGIS